MGCKGGSSRFCDTWKVNSKGILIKKNNTKLAMKVNAYLEQKKVTTICWWLLSYFYWDLLGPFIRNAYIKMLTDCNLVPENTQHLLARGLKPLGRPVPVRDQKLKLPYLQSVGAPIVVRGQEWMVHWVEKLLPRVKGSWAHCGPRALPFQ